MSRFQNISDEDFIKVVKENVSVRDILSELGYSRSSGSMGKKVRDQTQLKVNMILLEILSPQLQKRSQQQTKNCLILVRIF